MISIVTKLEMLGGSERRAIELNKTISELGIDCRLIATGKVSININRLTSATILPVESAKEIIEQSELVIVVCSDSKQITTLDYWNALGIDVSKPSRWLFIFNFLISSSISLGNWPAKEIILAPTSKKFFDEVSEQDRYLPVRHYRRIITRSPINKAYQQAKVNSDRFKISGFGKGNADKWNNQLLDLVEWSKDKYGDKILYLFQGVPSELRDKLNAFPNCEAVKENTYPVEQILRNSNVFLYYPTWKREEPWCRTIGEAMMSGTPAITTARGGSIDQITQGNTGYLCNSHSDFLKAIDNLYADRKLLDAMSRNCIAAATEFESNKVTIDLLRKAGIGI